MPQASTPRALALIVASALFMQNLDSSVVATALPAMARDLGEPVANLSVAITAYLVALTVFVPVSGWVADRFGAKRVFMAAILVFTIASGLCAAADGLAWLVSARVLQGVGGAMMVPVGRLLLLKSVTKAQMLAAMTWLTMPGLLGPVSGPPIGGLLTDLYGWRSVFLINLPIGVLGLVLVATMIPATPPDEATAAPDLKGLWLVGGALALGMTGLETVGRTVLEPLLAWGALFAGLGLGWLALRHCRRVARPALDLSLMTIPTFHAAAVAGSLFRIGAGVAPFLVPLLLQTVFGWSATQSGLVTFATAVGAFAMKPMAQPLLRRFGFRATMLANTGLAAAGSAAGALFAPGWPWWAMFVVLALGGLARSLQFTAMNTLAFADVPGARLSAATSLYGTLQQITPALGVVMASAVLAGSAALGGRAAPDGADFFWAFAGAGLLVLASAPLFAKLAPDAGADVSGHGGRGGKT
ncbi:MFS transporter [Humitalea sp. 24SJ18S-53]|uniref:MFS transporter n=1 Tax=Humitalea sp. 24SJ18S-53 TaxID=3422307 RepID=UPI003D66E01E